MSEESYSDVLQQQIERQEDQYNKFFGDLVGYSMQLTEAIAKFDEELDSLEENTVDWAAVAGARDTVVVVIKSLSKILQGNL